MYERFVRNIDSFWWPYLNVIPSLPEMHAPAVSYTDDELMNSMAEIFWNAYKDKKGGNTSVKKHLFSKYADILPPEVYTYDNYR